MTLTGYIVGTKGNTGRGIASIVENADYTITINLTDGTSYTTAPIAGFTAVDFDENYDLVVTKTDGTTETVETDIEAFRTVLYGYKTDAETAESNASGYATAASGSASTATAKAKEAESYAKGGTSSRTGEDTDNADYYRGLAAASATAAGTSESNAGTQALKSEGYAVGKQNGTDVSSGSDYYHNNAKYYSDMAHIDATDASDSQSSASGSASTASAQALKSEGYAVGKQNGTDVTSGSDYYQNNSKYYKEQAATSASSASTNALKAEGFAVGEQNGTAVSSGSPYYENNAEYYAGEAADSATAAAASAASIDPDTLATKNDISPIMERVISPNRFNKNGNILDGYYLNSSGEAVSSSDWWTTDYCYVGDLSTLYGIIENSNQTYMSISSLFYLCTYDINKNFIEQVGSMPSVPVSLSENVCYVRCSYKQADKNKHIMIGAFSNQDYYVGYYDQYYGVSKDVEKTFIDSFEFVPIALTLNDNTYITQAGYIKTITGDFKVSDPVDVRQYNKIMLSTFVPWGGMLYIFRDENGEIIDAKKDYTDSGTGTRIFNEIIDVPLNAKDIIIGVNTNTPEIALFGGVKQKAFRSKTWMGKKWVCIGDSLTEHNSRTTFHYYDYVKAVTGIEPYNMGVSGTGYAKGSGNNTAFYQRAASTPTDADVITVFGSFNDMSAGLPVGTYLDNDTTTLGGCINATIDAIQTRVPLANIGIISPTPWVSTQPNDTGMAYEYVAVMERICKHRSIPFLDLWRCSNLRPWDADFRAIAYTKDDGNGVHPDETGHKLIAPRFKAFLESLLLP